MSLIGSELRRPVDIIDLYAAGEPILGEVFKGERILGILRVNILIISR